MKTAVRRVLLMSALLSPTALNALGLGEIHLRSALNQPFDAEIELVSAAAEDLAALRASLASSETFTRYGLDRPAYLSDFTFRVERGADGRDVLRVTSPRPVSEPFVTLLVEANWPRGRLLREYTVLLDPPIFAPGPAASETPVATPRAVAPAPAPRRTEAAAPSAAPVPREPRAAAPVAAPPSIEPGSAYRVQRNDTLWRIASAANPGTRSDINRAMVAIYRSNPAAFDGNINILKAGSLLNIPTAAEMSSISASAAADEVSRQYRMWREGAAAAEVSDTGRLRLVTPEEGTPAASTATVQPAPAEAAATADLQSRVKQLESELAEARRLLEVRNAELATLQGQAPVTPPAEPVAEGEAPAPVEPAEQAPAEPPAEPVAEEAPLAPAEAAPAPAEQPAPPAEEGPTLLERVAGYWWVLLGLLAAVLAFVLYRRGRGESGAAEEDLAAALARREPGDLRARPVAVPKPREAEIVVEEQRPVEAAALRPVPVPAPVVAEPSRKPVSIEDTLSGETAVGLEAGDPLAEADFHMAYGLYDQAADLVQVAARREPRRRDLKLKLLEIFFVWGNRDRFLEMARELNATRSEAQPGEWDKVLIMGKQIAPDNPLFAGAARPAAAGLDMELHGATSVLDMDLGADTGAIAEVDLTAAAAEGTDGVGLDFVIDEPVRGAGDESALASTIETALAPTVETTRLAAAPAEEPTQEVAIEDLGLEAGSLQELADVEGAEDIFAPPAEGALEETVERTTIGAADEESEEDLLSATSILKSETGALAAMAAADETSVLDLADVTGELPTIEASKLGALHDVDLPLGDESTTMSEVGTKLDLARAYIDMGDPEGARSILEEVLNEGNAVQKKEAERLVASLP